MTNRIRFSFLKKSFILSVLVTLIFPWFLKAQDTKPKNKIMILPLVARSIETDWSFGAAVSGTFKTKDTTIRTSSIQGIALYSIKKQFVVALNSTFYFPKEREILNSQISYSSFPDKFWGIGPNSKTIDEENYEFEQLYTNEHFQKKIFKGLYFGAIFDRQKLFKLSYLPGGLFDKEGLPGKDGYLVSGLGYSITADTRNHAFTPSKGFFLQYSSTLYNKTFGSNFVYTNYIIDFRKYVSLNKHFVNAIQAYLFLNDGDKVPLRSLATFGGANNMRGFYSGRFRDKNQFVFQNELRFDVFKRLSAVAFVGFGSVAPSLSKFSLNNLKYSVGGGIRYALIPSEKLNIRIDYGIGLGYSKGLYIQVAEAF